MHKSHKITIGGMTQYHKHNPFDGGPYLHREDGPALEYPNGLKSWYLNGKRINCSSQEEFEKFLKLQAFW